MEVPKAQVQDDPNRLLCLYKLRRLGVAFFASNSVNRLNPTIFGINSSQLGSYLASRESVVGAASECNSLVAHVRTTCL